MNISDAAGWVNRSERVRFSLQRILSTLQDAESAARGYLISHEDVLLGPYRGARVQLDTELRSLTSLSLCGYALTMNEALDLLGAPWLAQLHSLALRDCKLSPHVVPVIVRVFPVGWLSVPASWS